MVETVLISTSCALSVLCLGIAIAALKAADPLMIRRLQADLSRTAEHFRSKLADLEEVELPRVKANADAVLEAAELKFDGAERKRKSVRATQQHADARDPTGNGGLDWSDESLPRHERVAALERAARGR